jgi:hypothetical protein
MARTDFSSIRPIATSHSMSTSSGTLSERSSGSTVKRLSDLGKPLLKELERFFVDYHALSKEKFSVEKCVGRRRALELIQRAKHQPAKSDSR